MFRKDVYCLIIWLWSEVFERGPVARKKLSGTAGKLKRKGKSCLVFV